MNNFPAKITNPTITIKVNMMAAMEPPPKRNASHPPVLLGVCSCAGVVV